MKYLNILTACAGLAIAVPTLNPRQSEIDEADKICKSREMDEHQCNDYKWLCQEDGNKDPPQLNKCLRKKSIFCVDDHQCGDGWTCIRARAPYARLYPGKCYRKKEQSQAVKRESVSDADEDRIQGGLVQESASDAEEDQTQAGEQESASPQTDVQAKLDKICDTRGITKAQCDVYKLHCQYISLIKEPDKLNYCVKVLGTDCKDDGQCGQGYECRKDPDRPNDSTCYPKREQSQAGEQESASAAKEPTQDNKQDLTSPAKGPTQDNKQDSTSPAKNQTQAREQELASQLAEINKIAKSCKKRGLSKAQCLTYRSYCTEGRGIVELDQLKHCVEVLGIDCKDDDQCGHGFECYKEDGVCDTKRSQAGEQESASPAKEPTQDTPTNITTPTKDQIQAGEQESASAAKEPTQAEEQESASPEINETDKICKTRELGKYSCALSQKHCREAGNMELDELNNCLKVVFKICKNDDECGHGLQCFNPTLDPGNSSICFNKNKPTKSGKQESASAAKKPTQDTTINIATPTKEPTQAGEQESASSEQTQDKKQDSTSPAKEPTQDTTTNVATPTKEPTQNTTTNAATPSRPCTKKPIDSSEKNPVVGAKSTEA
ncbi:hypothetical protein X797_008932 [Metarhizium robertsii]|uniref:Uncharacterized protein n=2 Tax=Metarhizium robertsii TaxID=568076 RepID=E9F8I0_METRA|nr:uncharacterized protein MAA_08579 [Metarhizium robertsii ARSEF 23]EFY95926.1 hypothetical protein MAA_08579 [Metarhizium robertsii ARSEF 23]EXU97933.1 hypothetical protein X797_008932 [Metarhizium robertsii]